ncbi:WD40 repeat-like protein [Periconia macrospinosa]|uniref:WD40 repeat-like protein n=1 Tax=Periconia macrospinosa TaxID=97972 RepID=A0A2V1DMF0_9PLEO|nr:WD40 repeat-like protein [Periconia macrospinosa]
MSDLNGTPKLKRKREGAEAQRKKVKTQKKGQNETATPVKETPTPVSKPGSAQKTAGTPTPKNNINSSTHKSAGNAVSSTPTADTPASSRKEKHRAESKKQKKKDAKASGAQDALQVLPVNGDAIEQTPKKKSKQKKQKEKSSDLWSISEAQGGWFLPQDPVFSVDEKYLLLLKPKSLEVYAAETSLLVRELPAGGSGVILASALSASRPNQVYITESNGIVTLWDWNNGSKISRWDISANVPRLVVVKALDSDQDLLFSYEAGNSHAVTVHALRTKEDASKTEFKRILKLSDPITDLQVILQGKIVVVSTANRILVGKRARLHKTALQDFEYTWRELEMSKRVTTFSAFVRIPDTDKTKNPSTDPRDHLDLAVGDEEGAIHLFENIISSFAAIERSQKEKPGRAIGIETFQPKRLHWHRDAVGSVKWSLDGNYLISGGDETVLTIWQLSTGQRQFLPHLTAAIEHIVVSPTGTSYGISLANNSVIVLSTSELEPKTNIVGIQSRRVDFDQLPRQHEALLSHIPFAVNPKHHGHVIFSTPSSQPRQHQRGLLPEPYAQTFDITTRRPISRQAITRNNATDPNMAPDGRKIHEPNVKFMQISPDGAWLATVDEWAPPSADLSYIEEGTHAFNEEARLLRRQVYLKIWRWDGKGAQWVLDSRIDAPHYQEDVSGHAEVFDLVTDPSGTGFATVGADRVVRVWRPKTRLRNGTVVRGADKDRGLVTWSLDRSIRIADQIDAADELTTLRTSRLAFSADASVLLAGVSWTSETDMGVIHVIDTNAGVIRRSITEVDVSALSGLGIVGRHLVAVGTSIIVWDMVSDQLVHNVAIESPGRLAVNEEDNSFAVAIPRFEKGASTRIIVLEPDQPKTRWARSIPGVVLAIAPAKSGRGYITLDSSSNLRTIVSRSNALQLPTPPPETITEVPTEDMELDQEESDANDALQFDTNEELLHQSENDKPVVRPEQLQQIFESRPSHTLPPVKDLFDAVVGLYARKPRVGVV